MKDDFFRREVDALKAEVEDIRVETVRKIIAESEQISLKDLLPKAMGVILQILDDPDSRNADKLRAAALIGDWSGVKVAASQAHLLNPDKQPFPFETPFLPQEGEIPDFSVLTKEEFHRLYLKSLSVNHLTDQELNNLYLETLAERKM